MISISTVSDQVFWYIPPHIFPPLTRDIRTEIVIVGGGMAGLTAAYHFAQKGCRVVLLEKNYCGAGATGKSSGFITPDSELSLHHFIQKNGAQKAHEVWSFVNSGVNHIRSTITTYAINCDYQEQDTLIVANSDYAFETDIQVEYEARRHLEYLSILYNAEQLPHVIGSTEYYGGISYGNTFGINGYQYCTQLKHILHQQYNVMIYEETPALEIKDHIVTTPSGSVRADYIIVCADYGVTNMHLLSEEVYHAQTFLMISTPLSDTTIQQLFPHKRYMVWDTDLIYQYYRVTGDNRILLGGANLLKTYATQESHHQEKIAQQLLSYFIKKFPQLENVHFEYMWPGLIGISKDLVPIAGFDSQLPSVYHVTACAGLPWAAALGAYSAARIVDNDTRFDAYFSPTRPFLIGPVLQRLLGTKLTFALSNYFSVG